MRNTTYRQYQRLPGSINAEKKFNDYGAQPMIKIIIFLVKERWTLIFFIYAKVFGNVRFIYVKNLSN